MSQHQLCKSFMSLSAKIWLSLLVGMAAGALAWSLLLPDNPVLRLNDEPSSALVAAVYGLTLGLGLGLVGAWAANARVEKKLSLGLGAGCGLAGALLGDALGTPLTTAIAHSMHGLSEPAQRALLTLGECSGWGMLGLVLGGGLGRAQRSSRLAWQGALGGLAGGLLGGIALETLAQTDLSAGGGAPLSAGEYWRQAAGPMALGGLTGLGIALAARLGRASWVRVQRGGREHILARPLMTIGQDKTCDIVLRGDPDVAPVHATVEAMPGGRHHMTVAAGGGRRFAPVTINGRPIIGEQWLADGDDLQIGEHALLFRERATQGALRLGPPQPQAWMKVLGVRPKPEPHLPSFSTPAPPAAPPVPDAPDTGPDAAPPAPSIPVLTLEALPLLGLSRDMAALSLSEDGGGKEGDAPLSALPALLSGIVLRAEQGPYVGRAFVVDALGVTRLGRAIEQEIPLPMDRTVSRLHARIVPEGDQFFLEDAGSANGTFVNGLRLTGRRVLRPGDVLQLGATVLRYT